MDPAGFSQRYLSYMPHANVFDGGDGLNTAIHQCQFGAHGTGDFNTAYGISFLADHHQENLKIDHIFNARHKIAFNGSYQVIPNDYIPVSGPTVQWPGGYLSKTLRKPRVLTANLTSTLSSSVLNEARVRISRELALRLGAVGSAERGGSESSLVVHAEWKQRHSDRLQPRHDRQHGDQRRHADDSQLHLRDGLRSARQLQSSVRIRGTLSWTKGRHGFKGGVDMRIAYYERF